MTQIHLGAYPEKDFGKGMIVFMVVPTRAGLQPIKFYVDGVVDHHVNEHYILKGMT